MKLKLTYCCKDFQDGLEGYRGGIHLQEDGYHMVINYREGRYSEYTAWEDYEYSKKPFKFCPFCGSEELGARNA